MKIHITPQGLSITPYLSTTWSNIASLKTEIKESKLILKVSLADGGEIQIDSLTENDIDQIFQAHAKAIEKSPTETSPFSFDQLAKMTGGIPIQVGGDLSEGLQSLQGALQHNLEQKNAPDLPKEMLDKVAAITKALGVDSGQVPEAEPHCNCPHCQIARAMHGQENLQQDRTDDGEEEVSMEDLKFREWDIVKMEDKLYQVTNPIDQTEKYQVYLGEPIGCTCGHNQCEHIKAVLES